MQKRFNKVYFDKKNDLTTLLLGVKRIMQEARELANESTYEYDAHPLEVSFHTKTCYLISHY